MRHSDAMQPTPMTPGSSRQFCPPSKRQPPHESSEVRVSRHSYPRPRPTRQADSPYGQRAEWYAREPRTALAFMSASMRERRRRAAWDGVMVQPPLPSDWNVGASHSQVEVPSGWGLIVLGAGQFESGMHVPSGP